MEILLTQSVDSLGKRGDRVNVAKGYFRNFLRPRGMAVLATDGNLRAMAEEDRVRARKDRKNVVAAEELRKIVEGVTLQFSGQTTEEGHLYGSVTAQNIAKELQAKGYQIETGMVDLEEHIKELGEYPVILKLHRGQGVEATIKVVVSGE
ncbi:MAG: 50S ribosomal protein L9 [Candidatus Krumholzibacteriia bacterium]|nr:50S ribosomal protein L9 [bacterium]MCB9514837.1 50S ribosomal protein L9 [Candidatus Latescibacterota bacterium]